MIGLPKHILINCYYSEPMLNHVTIFYIFSDINKDKAHHTNNLTTAIGKVNYNSKDMQWNTMHTIFTLENTMWENSNKMKDNAFPKRSCSRFSNAESSLHVDAQLSSTQI